MSRSGASVSDWQDIFNAVNERRQALAYRKDLRVIPVPQLLDHLTSGPLYSAGSSSGLVHSVPLDFCDPYSPLKFRTWSETYSSGTKPVGVNHLDINRYAHGFGDYPKRGAILANTGWFLDGMDSAIQLLTKYAESHGEATWEYASRVANFRWDLFNDEVWDNQNGVRLDGLTFSGFSDFYAYAHAHAEDTNQAGDFRASVQITNGSDYGGRYNIVNVRYTRLKGIVPGIIPADLTLYYSSWGDDLGFAVNSYINQQTGVETVSYSTRTYSTVTGQTVIGFSDSIFPQTPPTLDAYGEYTKEERLTDVFYVYDFSNYFQY